MPDWIVTTQPRAGAFPNAGVVGAVFLGGPSYPFPHLPQNLVHSTRGAPLWGPS
jgi:hypothetical protein